MTTDYGYDYDDGYDDMLNADADADSNDAKDDKYTKDLFPTLCGCYPIYRVT